MCDLFGSKCRSELARANERIATLESEVGAYDGKIDELLSVVNLMENGPGAPSLDRMRVLSRDVMHQELTEVFGERYTGCPHVLLSDGDWLVGPKQDMDFYLDYYSMFWLPKLKPYKIIEWTRLDSTKVQIWARDCDDFSDFLQGVPTMHLDRTPLPWGQMWGKVEGAFISGGHAFNFMLTCDESFDEVTTAGLETWLIEPQKGRGWSVPTPEGPLDVYQVASYRLRPMADFTVLEIWFMKV